MGPGHIRPGRSRLDPIRSLSEVQVAHSVAVWTRTLALSTGPPGELKQALGLDGSGQSPIAFERTQTRPRHRREDQEGSPALGRSVSVQMRLQRLFSYVAGGVGVPLKLRVDVDA